MGKVIFHSEAFSEHFCHAQGANYSDHLGGGGILCFKKGCQVIKI